MTGKLARVRRYGLLCCSDRTTKDFLYSFAGLLVLIIYMLIFAAMMQAVEKDDEASRNREITQVLLAIKQNISSEAFETLISIIDYDPIRGKEDFTSYNPETGDWVTDGSSLGSAYYFSYTLISTIGYGDVAPITPAGRVLAIICVILGVPIAVVVYSRIADAIFKVILACMLRRTNRFQLVLQQYDTDGSGSLDVNELENAFADLGMKIETRTIEEIVKTFDKTREGGLNVYELSEAANYLGLDIDAVAKSRFKIRLSAFLVLAYTLITAAYLSDVLGISYLDSIYYSVMTFTTAGLGDITISKELRPAITIISMFALAFFAMFVDGMASYEKSGLVAKMVKSRLLKRHSLTIQEKLTHLPGGDNVSVRPEE